MPDHYFQAQEVNRKIKLEKKELKVLITTSTAREGFNLLPESGVKNIISCFTDGLHVTQFAGRARYNLDTIVVADTYVSDDNLHPDSYLSMERRSFHAYMQDKNCLQWFGTVAHLVAHDIYGVKRFVLGPDDQKFISYINHKWLVPIDASAAERDVRKIWREQDKKEIMKKFCDYRMTRTPLQYVTFNGVVNALVGQLGYTVDSGRQRIEKEQRTYKLIISFDDEKVQQNPHFPLCEI